MSIAQMYYQACLAELQALKPGNVHIFADGHGMKIEDFMASAEASSQTIARLGLSLGARILHSVQATQNAVHCNTNLGIILLCAPLIQAKLKGADLQANIRAVLTQTTVQDAEECFEAIRLAKPGGLGASAQHDVHQAATVNLETAMRSAQDKDMIARQYSNDFADVIAGADFYAQCLQTRNAAWATSTLYLYFLSQFADSHIVRKQGTQTAQAIQAEAARQLAHLQSQENPKLAQKALLTWDTELKLQGINPGTSADLTVASVLLHQLKQN